MIKIKRGERPPILEDDTPNGERYKDDEVVKALFEMQHGKCCYCEEKTPEKGHGRAVEHYRPKSGKCFPHLKNVWENLLMACSTCNGKKWNHFPTDEQGNPLVIDPSNPDVDPEDHIDFIADDESTFFGAIIPKYKSEIGAKTISTIGLHREFLRQKRMEFYRELYLNFLDIVIADNNSKRKANIHKFESLMNANSQFAAFARSFARKKNLDQYGVRIPVGSAILGFL